MTTFTAKGSNGSISFDGRFVTLSFLKFDKRGGKVIPVKSITSVQLKRAGVFSQGQIEITFPGMVETNGKVGFRASLKAENMITFGARRNDDFEAMRNAILGAL